jgi:hypothetical protein
VDRLHGPAQLVDLTRIRTDLGFEVQYPLGRALGDYAGWLAGHLDR